MANVRDSAGTPQLWQGCALLLSYTCLIQNYITLVFDTSLYYKKNMIDKKSLIKLFDRQKLGYKLYNHPPLFTVEDSKNMRGSIEGAHTKNLFLKNKKNDFFLITCIENTLIFIKNLSNKFFSKPRQLSRLCIHP